MSSTSAPFGFAPIYHPSGQIVANIYQPTVANGPSSAIYKGDPVKLVGTTDVINLAATSDAIIGVFAGCEYTDSTGKPTVSSYWPGTTTGATGIKFYVYDDPFIVYEVQANGSLAVTDIGASSDSVGIGSGNANTGVSSGTISATTTGAATVKQWRILGLGQQTNNAWGDTYVIARVKIGQSQLITEPNSI